MLISDCFLSVSFFPHSPEVQTFVAAGIPPCVRDTYNFRSGCVTDFGKITVIIPMIPLFLFCLKNVNAHDNQDVHLAI
jgi:hypothetical protein